MVKNTGNMLRPTGRSSEHSTAKRKSYRLLPTTTSSLHFHCPTACHHSRGSPRGMASTILRISRCEAFGANASSTAALVKQEKLNFGWGRGFVSPAASGTCCATALALALVLGAGKFNVGKHDFRGDQFAVMAKLIRLIYSHCFWRLLHHCSFGTFCCLAAMPLASLHVCARCRWICHESFLGHAFSHVSWR